ncbi:16S rRNA (cytidine(1402)-2'-O)-methyltransferase [Geitlerinema sp. PCC 9228]|jgi:16S rRNA (cytidine1402-2'-O)-methyltransferase|uniref:16S rRNA (cytidine(1402)-2'-O)-methyltransferase n=1 Tax=Geitlerinema sp. PCC 9228 TaxID=111611 RepID=UPI0008F9CF85|nr:16S rRNA (cytidine(1402)-2'-O)-methyltransferase [Geitlerinema sp. PCC 9228]
MDKVQPKTLYLVGTPIGNLEDMTFRAVRVLQEVDLIAAEDTRHTGKLLQHFQIQTPQLSYYQHNSQKRIPDILTALHQGKAIALVTDAGMPGVSDPGCELVQACIEANISIIPIPGATAAIAALSASGLPTDAFVFVGFLPLKSKVRSQILQSLQAETRTLLFYEAPHRIVQTLQDLASHLGENRQVVVAREITKRYEDFWRGTVADAIASHSQTNPKGEYTIVLAGNTATEKSWSPAAIKTELQQLLAQGYSRSQASRQLATVTNLPRREIYQMALTIADSTQ